jgi:microcystin-dependent protein
VTATANQPATNLLLAVSTPQSLYTSATNLQVMSPTAVANVGGSQAHLNMQPFLTLSFCIALQGIFPSAT